MNCATEPASRYPRPRSAPCSPRATAEIKHASSASTDHVRERRVFLSPRCQVSDQELFPSEPHLLREHSNRWQFLSQQAGQHRQDGSILRLNYSSHPRQFNPAAIRSGMPPSAAARVRQIYLPSLDEKENTSDDDFSCSSSDDVEDEYSHRSLLPEWLDVVAATFFNLEHLYLGDPSSTSTMDTMSKEERLRRLSTKKMSELN